MIVGANSETRERAARHDPAIRRLARAGEVGFADEAPKGAAQIVLGEATICLPLGDLIDVSAEAARLQREIERNQGEISRIEKKLGNEKFVANAPAEVVEADREKLAELTETGDRLKLALQRVEAAA